MNSKKRALRAFIVFLCVMGALTYLSRTLYYGTLPNVETGYLTGGRLKFDVYGTEFRVETGEGQCLRISKSLGESALYIADIKVERRDRVKDGDAIVEFDEVVGQYALDSAHARLRSAQWALNAWAQSRSDKADEMQTEIDQATLDIEGTADIEKAADDVRALQRELDAMQAEDITQNMEWIALYDACKAAAQTVDALEDTASDGWTLRADGDCIVTDVFLQAGETYAGLTPICALVSEDSELLVGVAADRALDEKYIADITVYANDDASDSGWTFDHIENTQDGQVLWARSDTGAAALNALKKLTFHAESDWYQYMAPNSAISGTTLYILRTRSASFGGEEDYAVAVDLLKAPSDGENTAILTGVSSADSIIVKWDRPFGDGDTVFVAYD